MKAIHKFTLLLSFTILSIGAMAQGMDEERMARDLKIAEDILGTLANQDNRMWYHDNIESNYVPDYGVVFTIPMRQYIIKASAKGNVVYSTGSGRGATVIRVGGDKDDDPDVEVESEVDADNEVEIDQEKVKKEIETATREQMVTFLADYADLIGQLKPTNRVVLQTKSRRDMVWSSRSTQESGGLTAQAMKSDISAYKQGKISREAFEGKIEFTEGGEKAAKDIELFATIFSRLYEEDMSSTYYLSSRHIAFTSLKNMGVTFSLKFYSSSSDDGLHTIRTTGEGGLTQEERNKKVNAMYPDFEQSFKENLLDYGRTIKSLDSDEMLIFKARLTECRGCEMPDEIEVSVKMKTLQDYDKGTLSKSKALEQITVKKK